MPALLESNARAGRLRPSLATELGLSAGVVVAAGAGDNAATAIGAGTIADRGGFLSLGTSGVIFTPSRRFLPMPETAVHSFCHALPDLWHHMAVMLQASAALEWFAQICGQSPAELTGRLGDRLDISAEGLFLPYLSGERTPFNAASLRGGFHGLSARDTRESLTHMVLEGVAFGLRNGLMALHQAGSRPESLLALGGGANSPYWLQVIANVLDLPLEVPQAGDFGAAFGAARLGLMAYEGATPSEVCTPPDISSVILPQRELVAHFAQRYEGFSALTHAALG